MRVLIKAGADVNAQNKNGNSALHLAALEGYSQMAIWLIKAGAFKGTLNKWGLRAYQMAESNGHSQTVFAIVETKPDVEIPTK